MKLDNNGTPFNFPTYELPKKEYARIIGEINTNYFRYIGQPFAIHYSYDLEEGSYLYYFENRGYNNYNIVSKQPLI